MAIWPMGMLDDERLARPQCGKLAARKGRACARQREGPEGELTEGASDGPPCEVLVDGFASITVTVKNPCAGCATRIEQEKHHAILTRGSRHHSHPALTARDAAEDGAYA
uniref:Uncharacterized protein n=1 Tax=Coccidioides posadasii RMSCC 3488 TaxID=454284 RepID=A0A0J6F8V9_COCPO|nr:hypothetical protein CPAG_02941 [Coccidioides posadasii RMSCC 3488]